MKVNAQEKTSTKVLAKSVGMARWYALRVGQPVPRQKSGTGSRPFAHRCGSGYGCALARVRAPRSPQQSIKKCEPKITSSSREPGRSAC